MKTLVDANVLSEPTRMDPNRSVVEWLRKNEHLLVVDPIVLGEIKFGIEILPKGRRRSNLNAWFDRGVSRIECLPWDAATGLRWAELLAALRRRGLAMPVKDSMIAATALRHGFRLATRNVGDFGKSGVKLVNPFEE